jgi:hypothetical protein
MKYIKTYEGLDLKGKYYKIHVRKSLERFDIALEKMGVKEMFYINWSLEKIEDIFDENQKTILDNDIIYFLIINDYTYLYRNSLYEINKVYQDIISSSGVIAKKLEYGGEIFVEDYEIDSRKYNL